MSGEMFKRPWLGVIGLSITEEIARYYGLPVGRGVLVTKVTEGSPADDAGMADGDIILEIDDAETRSMEDLVKEIRKRKVGDRIRIFALRNSREHFFELEAGPTAVDQIAVPSRRESGQKHPS